MSSIDMAPGWAERIEEAQKEPTEEIGGKVYQRVRYGTETDYPSAAPNCRDCGVEHLQYHVIGCCVERCCKCLGQAYGCPCVDATEH